MFLGIHRAGQDEIEKACEQLRERARTAVGKDGMVRCALPINL